MSTQVSLGIGAACFWLIAGGAKAASLPAEQSCAALVGNHGAGMVVVTATAVQPNGAWLPPARLGTPAPVTKPFCRVEGRVGQFIGFELWLPPQAAWNGRLLGAGVGGDAGVYNFRDLARGVEAGFASATTDGGHKASETLWMMRRDAVLDYTHRAQHALNVAARKLTRVYYGRDPHHAYFLGCSGGGRQALKEMQRYPQDYDGIVAGAAAPAMPEMSARHLWQALYQQRNPSAALTAQDWALVAQHAVSSCDSKDGVVDGVVENPAVCPVDFSALQCRANGAPACLTAAKLATVAQFSQPLHDENGRKLDNGLLPGVGSRPGPPSPLLLPLFAQAAHGNPMWKAESFHIARDVALVNRRMPEMRADDPNLQAFAARGGKAILYQGWLDPSVIASQSLDYFTAVKQRMGTRTHDMLRLYMVPGMLHCRGGAGVDEFGGSASRLPIGTADRDLLTAVVQWVESGVAPQSITATRLHDTAAERERPLCPYPQEARFLGGDIKNAASYRCE